MTEASSAGGMACLEWGRTDRPVDLVFLHANGFNAATYSTLFEPLSERFRILAPDLRGHGATTLPAEPVWRPDWKDFEGDVTALLQALDRPVVLAGHSMGGAVALMAARCAPEKVKRLVLMDPVILPPLVAGFMRAPFAWRTGLRHPLTLAALKRRTRFDSHAAAVRAYTGRGAFRDWPARTLEDYVRAGFRPASDGGVELACAARWEASNYAAQANDVRGALRRSARPVTLIRAERGSTCSITPSDAGRMPHLEVRTAPGGTHFFPMTLPQVARDGLVEAMEG